MGSWDYYLEIKTDKATVDRMICEYEKDQTYQKLFYFGACEDGFCDGYNACIISLIDNFLPANHLIYNFLSSYSSHNLCIRINGIELMYNFTEKKDFIKFMYDTLESKIDFAYAQLGVIVISHRRYHKIRNKLYKKYYVRIPKSIKSYLYKHK